MLYQILRTNLIGELFLLLLIYWPTIIYLFLRNKNDINPSHRGVDIVIKKNNVDLISRMIICLYAFIVPVLLYHQWKLEFYEKGNVMPFVFGVFCAASTYFVLSYFDPQIRDIARLRKFTNLNVIGEFTNVYDSAQINSFRERILTSLNTEKRPLIILCTSLGQEEGKSIVAASLAKSFSRLHSKVLLMEIDPWCDMPNNFIPNSQRSVTLGISDYILNECDLDTAYYAPMEESFTVLPRGNKVDAPFEMLNSTQLLDAIMESMSRFSVIVIDAPTISQFPEVNRFLLNHGVVIMSVSHRANLKNILKINEFIKQFSLKTKTGLILTRDE